MQDEIVKNLAVLELRPGAGFKDVKKAYRDLSTIWHPDRQPERLKSRATARLTQINLAYEWLSKNQYRLSKLSSKTVKPPAGSIIKCVKCNTRNRIDTDLKNGAYFRKYTCRACNEFLFVIARCRTCGYNNSKKEIRVFQETEFGKYKCKFCEDPLFGILKCNNCGTKNCITPSKGKEKPVCSKCRNFLLAKHRKSSTNKHILYAVGGAIIGAILGALGS